MMRLRAWPRVVITTGGPARTAIGSTIDTSTAAISCCLKLREKTVVHAFSTAHRPFSIGVSVCPFATETATATALWRTKSVSCRCWVRVQNRAHYSTAFSIATSRYDARTRTLCSNNARSSSSTTGSMARNISNDTDNMLRILVESDPNEWSHSEKALVQAWQQYQQVVDDMTRNDSVVRSDESDASESKNTPLQLLLQPLGRLIKCFQDLDWWDAALEMEDKIWEIVSGLAQRHDGHNDVYHYQYLQGESLYHQARCRVFLQHGKEARLLYTRAIQHFEAAAITSPSSANSSSSSSAGGDGSSTLNGQSTENIVNHYQVGIGDALVALAGLDFQSEQYDAALLKLQQAEPHFGNETSSTALSATTSSETASTTPNSVARQFGLVKCLQQQGLVHRVQEEYALARDVYHRATELAMTLPDDTVASDENDVAFESTGSTNNNMRNKANGSSSMTIPKDAWWDFRIIVRKPKRQIVQELTLDLADVHLAMDDYDHALVIYKMILNGTDVAAAADDDIKAVVWRNIGKIYTLQGDHNEAIDCLERSLELQRRLVAPVWHHVEMIKTLQALGAVHALLNHNEKAHDCLSEALLMARASVPAGQSAEHNPLVVQALYKLKQLEKSNT
jgi:tetratricopeptide (TPR) repeat protein